MAREKTMPELGASGATLSRAGKELGIASNTAMSWEKYLKETIENRTLHIGELQEKYCNS